jgi:hypothetical protein
MVYIHNIEPDLMEIGELSQTVIRFLVCTHAHTHTVVFLALPWLLDPYEQDPYEQDPYEQDPYEQVLCDSGSWRFLFLDVVTQGGRRSSACQPSRGRRFQPEL